MAELLNEDEITPRPANSSWEHEVRLSLTNHSAGALTEADFEMAKRFDQLSQRSENLPLRLLPFVASLHERRRSISK